MPMRRWVLVGALLSLGWVPVVGADDGLSPPPALLLAPGQIHTVPVQQVERIAIGDPEIVDVTIVSPSQLLVQGKKIGTTNLLLWDARGEQQIAVTVTDPRPEAVSQELKELVRKLGYPALQVELRSGKVFLVGEVETAEQQSALEQMASSFQGVVVNLVTMKTKAPAAEAPGELVRLSVQVIDISRSDMEKLGVKWSESVALTETQPAASSISDQLLRIGESAQRTNFVATLNALVQKNKARILSEPKLVTASGKEASSFIGVEVPIISATSISTDTTSVNASIEFRKTGVLLKMTPRVRPHAQITTTMEAEVSSVDSSVGLTVPVGSKTVLVPGFKVRKASTEVTTASGETIVIAGLLEAEDSDTVSQVPALGSMPVLGRLFRSPELKATQRELVITVTPELLGGEETEADRRVAVEQALAVAEVTASVDDPRLRYALQVQERIAKALRYPQREKELNLDGTVKLTLHLFADGTLGRAVVSESSGLESLDLEALKAAESQAPYPAFPSQLSERELWLEVPVIFRP